MVEKVSTLDIEFSNDGSQLATAGADGTVGLWDARTGEPLVMLRGNVGLVSDVSFDADGSHLASTSADGVVRVWTLDLDELIQIAHRELTRGPTADECESYAQLTSCAAS